MNEPTKPESVLESLQQFAREYLFYWLVPLLLFALGLTLLILFTLDDDSSPFVYTPF